MVRTLRKCLVNVKEKNILLATYVMSFFCMLIVTNIAKKSLSLCAISYIFHMQSVLFTLAGTLHLKVKGKHLDITKNQTDTKACILSVWARWLKYMWSFKLEFLAKFWPFYSQIGHKYDEAYICGRIVYHFNNPRKVFMVESKF